MLDKDEISIAGRSYKVPPFKTLVEVNKSVLCPGEKLKVRAVFVGLVKGERMTAYHHPVAILSPCFVDPEKYPEKIEPMMGMKGREAVYAAVFDTAGLPEGRCSLVVKYDEKARGGKSVGIDIVQKERLQGFLAYFVKGHWSKVVEHLRAAEPGKVRLDQLFDECLRNLEKGESGRGIAVEVRKIEGPKDLVGIELPPEPTRGIVRAILEFARRTVFPSGHIDVSPAVEGDQMTLGVILKQDEGDLPDPGADIDLLKETIPGIDCEIRSISHEKIDAVFSFSLKEQG